MNRVPRVGVIALAVALLACGPEAATTPMAVDLLTASQPSQACMDALATGQLVADPRSGVGIAAAGGERYSVMWPFGYSAVYADDRLWLLDPDGTPIAAEGDVIQMGGGHGNDLFYACAGSIERVQ